MEGRCVAYQMPATIAITTKTATITMAGVCDFFASGGAAVAVAAGVATGTGLASAIALVIPASVLPAPVLAAGGTINVGSDGAVRAVRAACSACVNSSADW